LFDKKSIGFHKTNSMGSFLPKPITAMRTNSTSRLGVFPILFLLFISFTARASNELVEACKAGDLQLVKELVTKKADVNFKDANGNTPICSAFFWPEITQFLLENGADVNGGNYPAIVSATNNYSVEVMKILLDAGADPNKAGKADPGVTLRKMLEDEKAKGKKANKTLIDAWEGVLKNMQPVSVYAIQLAVQQTNCVPCLELLLNHEARIDVVSDGNLLHTLSAFGMSREGRKEAFSKGKTAMESYGLKVPDWYANLPDEKNGTTEQMLSLLLSHGADVNKTNSQGMSPLLTALGTQKINLAKALVEAGADVNYVAGENGKDPVAFAAELGDVDLLKSLIDKGADVTRETWDLDVQTGSYCKGFTALTRAVIYDNYDCAKLLIDSGCKIREGVSGFFSKEARSSIGGARITNLAGKQLYCRYKLKNKMAIYFAIENNNLEMVKLLASSFGWYQNHSMEMDAQVGALEDASALKGACLAAGGKFTPSRYAKTLGLNEIQKYLESEGK